MITHFSCRRSAPVRLAHIALAASLALAWAGMAAAEQPRASATAQFSAKSADFDGRIRVTDTPEVLAGKPVSLAGRNFQAGQKVTLSYGGVQLGQTATVGEDGTFKTRFTVPADADPGRYQLIGTVTHPAASLLVPLKISPTVPLSAGDKFTTNFKSLVPGLYEVAWSADEGTVFVAATHFSRGPDKDNSEPSKLLKINADTLEIEASVAPAKVPEDPDAKKGGHHLPVYGVFGIGTDDAHDTVWTTNTIQGTVAVYRQSDLGLVKQFEDGLTPHSRDVVVDEKQGKAYVTAFGSDSVVVFDTEKLTKIADIQVETTRRGRDVDAFAPIGIAVDESRSRVFVTSMSTNEAAVIDTRTDKVVKVWPLTHSERAFDVAWDGKNNRLLVVSTGTDNLLMIDAETGKTVHDVATGAGPLSVAFDPVHELTYVANRGSGTVTVVDAEGNIIGNLAAGTYPNHLRADGKGGVYVVNKSRGKDDPEGDRIGYIAPH